MRRLLATFALALLSVATVRADDEVARAVAALVAKLGDDNAATREAALTDLVHLGVKAEAAVRAELARATDPEVKGRLMAAIQAYAIIAEENYALERIRKNEPFPPSQRGFDRMSLTAELSLAEAVEKIRKDSGVKIELYEGDGELKRVLEAEPYMLGSTSSGKNAAEWGLWNVLRVANLAYVVDGERVVIVRLTPAVLFERLGREPQGGRSSWLEEELEAFESGPHSYWLSVRQFVRDTALAGGPNRDMWFLLLRNRALDVSETPRNRTAALLGLAMFLGANDQPQNDVDDVFIRITIDPEAPLPVRTAAARGMVMGLTTEAQDAVLDVLGGKDPALQQDLLDALMDAGSAALSVRRRMEGDEKRMARYWNEIDALAASKDEELATRATILHAAEGDAASVARLVELPEPAGPQARLHFLSTLHFTKDPKARERFLSFRKHADPEVRAAVVGLVGMHSGGKDREPDVELATGLLGDPAPIVRKFAVGALAVIYSPRASERFDTGRGETRDRLAKMLQGELDPRVTDALRAAIADLDK